MRITEAARIFAIGDLHLPGGFDKPMHIFGDHWEDHFSKISRDWQDRVSHGDIVLIPGDISWAMQLGQAMGDLRDIGALPGTKIMIRGNHDYWWSAISKLRDSLPESLYALQNDAMLVSGVVFCGSRGWLIPALEDDPENRKIYDRELIRMELSLQMGRRLSGDGRLVAMTHYPPADESGRANAMTQLFSRYRADDVVYGHLHGQANEHAFSGEIDYVRYHPCSCDGLGFRLFELPDSRVGDQGWDGAVHPIEA